MFCKFLLKQLFSLSVHPSLAFKIPYLGNVAEGQWPVRGSEIDYYSWLFTLINGLPSLSLETDSRESKRGGRGERGRTEVVRVVALRQPRATKTLN